jgi:hypothetical protein
VCETTVTHKPLSTTIHDTLYLVPCLDCWHLVRLLPQEPRALCGVCSPGAPVPCASRQPACTRPRTCACTRSPRHRCWRGGGGRQLRSYRRPYVARVHCRPCPRGCVHFHLRRAVVWSCLIGVGRLLLLGGHPSEPCLLSLATVGGGVCAGDKVELPAPGTWVGAAGAVLRNAGLFEFNAEVSAGQPGFPYVLPTCNMLLFMA